MKLWKKAAAVLAAGTLLLGCAACGGTEEAPEEELSLEKAVRIEKRLAEDDSLLAAAEEAEELEALESRLLTDRGIGEAETLPEGAVPLYRYVVYQEGTVLAGQDSAEERPMEELLRFTLYEDSDLMTMEVAPELLGELPLLGDLLTFTWSLPREDLDYLLAWGA